MDAVEKWWKSCHVKELVLILVILYTWSTCSKKEEPITTTDDQCNTPKQVETTPTSQIKPKNAYQQYPRYAPQYRPLPENEDTSIRYRYFSSPYQSYNYYDHNHTSQPPFSNQGQVTTPYNVAPNIWQQPTVPESNYYGSPNYGG